MTVFDRMMRTLMDNAGPFQVLSDEHRMELVEWVILMSWLDRICCPARSEP